MFNWQSACVENERGVGEGRRTLRAIILSTIIRPFYQWAKEYLNDKEGKKLYHIIKGSDRVENCLSCIVLG